MRSLQNRGSQSRDPKLGRVGALVCALSAIISRYVARCYMLVDALCDAISLFGCGEPLLFSQPKRIFVLHLRDFYGRDSGDVVELNAFGMPDAMGEHNAPVRSVSCHATVDPVH